MANQLGVEHGNSTLTDRIILAAPYQEISNGDVLIQLGLHRDVRDETVFVWVLLFLTLGVPPLVLPPPIASICCGP